MPPCAAPAGAPRTTEWDFQRDKVEGKIGQGGQEAVHGHGGQDGRHQCSQSAGPDSHGEAAVAGAAAQRAQGEAKNLREQM